MESKRKEHPNKIEWLNENNELHRLDGPAVEYINGHKQWWVNGKCHREDSPAVELIDGTKSWYINGLLHREDGPAIERGDGNRYWYLNGKDYSEERWKEEVVKLKLMRIKDL